MKKMSAVYIECFSAAEAIQMSLVGTDPPEYWVGVLIDKKEPLQNLIQTTFVFRVACLGDGHDKIETARFHRVKQIPRREQSLFAEHIARCRQFIREQGDV